MKKRLMAFVALCFLFMIQGCKQDMDLNPQDYFSGQQLELAKAIEEGDVDAVKTLAPDSDLNKPGKQDMTLLFWAIGNAINDKKTSPHLKVITLLVKAGADPLQPRPQGKSSPAEFALKGDSADWINAMLDGGLSPNVKDKVFHEPIIFQSLKAKIQRRWKPCSIAEQTSMQPIHWVKRWCLMRWITRLTIMSCYCSIVERTRQLRLKMAGQ